MMRTALRKAAVRNRLSNVYNHSEEMGVIGHVALMLAILTIAYSHTGTHTYPSIVSIYLGAWGWGI
jgi:hypothetical protein